MPNALSPQPDKTKVHETFEQFLLSRGMRQTHPRRIIVDALLAAGPHADTDTIAIQARKLDKKVGIATIYRTLQLMTEAGILIERHFSKGRSQFEFSDILASHHHDHIICARCARVVEFFDETIETQQKGIAERLGFELLSHKVILYGYCQDCKRQ